MAWERRRLAIRGKDSKAKQAAEKRAAEKLWNWLLAHPPSLDRGARNIATYNAPRAKARAAEWARWQAEADAIWAQHPRHSKQRVATLVVDWLNLTSQLDRLPALAADLVSRRVAVIATLGGVAPAQAAKAATSTIPIVFHIGGDPVEYGLVPSLNRPGGNVTGVSFLTVALAPKRLAMLHELVPTAKIIGLLNNQNNPNAPIVMKSLEVAARTLGLRLHVQHASTERDIAAFASFVQQRVGAIFVDADQFLLVRRGQIAALALRHALPGILSNPENARAGGLMSYGSNAVDAYHQAGIYTGRILKGEKPADLPVVQSAKFEFVINLTTAKVLGLEVPPICSLLPTR